MATNDDYELQIAELNDTIEIMTLDKEQLMIEKELLEEKYNQLEQQFQSLEKQTQSSNNVSNNISSITTQEMNKLQDENDKLREALRRLNDISIKDKEELQLQNELIDSMQQEIDVLKQSKERDAIEMENLKSQIDSLSSVESMIETLSNENFELKNELQTCKETISELEDAQELNEELDQQQRQQLDLNRIQIENLSVNIVNSEQKLIDKDNQINDIVKRLDYFKEMNLHLKQENESMRLKLQSGKLENKENEEKIKEINSLTYQNQDYWSMIQWFKQQYHQLLMQKYRYQTLANREEYYLQPIHTLYLEENKLLTTELLFVQTISNGLETIKWLAEVISFCMKANQYQLSIVNQQSIYISAYPLYMVVIAIQSQLIQFFVQFLTQEESLKLQNSQDMIDLSSKMIACRDIFEKIIALCANNYASLVNSTSPANSFSSLLESAAIQGSPNPLLSSKSFDDSSNSTNLEEFIAKELKDYLTQISSVYSNDIVDSSSSDGAISDSTSVMLKKGVNSYQLIGQFVNDSSLYHVPTLHIESNLLLFSSLIEYMFVTYRDAINPLIFPISSSSSTSSASSLLSPIKNSTSDASTTSASNSPEGELFQLVKSIKVELEQISCTYRHTISSPSSSNNQILSYFFEQKQQLQIWLFTLFDCCFDAERNQFHFTFPSSKELNQLLVHCKNILPQIRKFQNELNALDSRQSLTSSSTSSVSYHSMKYFDNSLWIVTNVRALPKDLKELNEQHYDILDRYWQLLYQGFNDLIPFEMGVEPSSSGSQENAMAWKQRINALRKLIPSQLSSASSVPSNTSDLVSSNTTSTSKASTQLASEDSILLNKVQYQSMLKELDIKKDELKSVMNQCNELQEMVEKLTHSSVQKEQKQTIDSLQKEIKTLENALTTLELKSDELTKENKLLKAGGGSSTGVSKSNLKEGSAASKGVKKGANLAMDPDLMALLNKSNTSGSTLSTSTVSASLRSTRSSANISSLLSQSSTSNVLSLETFLQSEYSETLYEQLQYWRKLALQKTCQSLLPLTAPQLTPTVPSTRSFTTPSFTLEVPQITGDDKDIRRAYHKIRLERAKSSRIISLASSNEPHFLDPLKERQVLQESRQARHQTLAKGGLILYKLSTQISAF